ncbi:MAG: hypothetical protein KKH28_13190, partial [Elusimicrobia bacterium]|nr:hypothetical protein [Elusimicrobiota bacterium]
MKKDFLRHICCPECGSEFTIEEFAANGPEVVEGLLRCAKCAINFPVINNVPRILRPAMMGELVGAYAGFCRKYSRRLQMPDNALAAPDVSRSLKVAKMYEYGWSIYSKVAEEYKREFDDV